MTRYLLTFIAGAAAGIGAFAELNHRAQQRTIRRKHTAAEISDRIRRDRAPGGRRHYPLHTEAPAFGEAEHR